MWNKVNLFRSYNYWLSTANNILCFCNKHDWGFAEKYLKNINKIGFIFFRLLMNMRSYVTEKKYKK